MRGFRRISRRSFLATVVGGASTGTLLLLTGQNASAAQPGCSDRDPTDPQGRGRSCGGGSGCSDNDPSDPAGGGVRCGGGCSDSDPGDPTQGGRRCGGGGGSGGGGGVMANACTLCSCAGFVQAPDTAVTACASPGCGHGAMWHAPRT